MLATVDFAEDVRFAAFVYIHVYGPISSHFICLAVSLFVLAVCLSCCLSGYICLVGSVASWLAALLSVWPFVWLNV